MRVQYPILPVIFLILAIITTACQKNSTSSLEISQPLTLRLNVKETNGSKNNSSSPLLPNINRIMLEISGEGLDQPLVKQMNLLGSEARTTLFLPLGQKRFSVLGSVANDRIGINLFEGEDDIVIAQNTQDIEIGLYEIAHDRREVGFHNNQQTSFKRIAESDIALISRLQQPYSFFLIGFRCFFRGTAQGEYSFGVFERDENEIRSIVESPPLIREPGPGDWITWWINWNGYPEEGLVDSEEYIYYGFVHRDNSGFPEIAVDNSIPEKHSFMVSLRNRTFFPEPNGNYLMTAIIQTTDLQKLYVTPSGVFKEYSELKKWEEKMVHQNRKSN